MTYKLKVRRFGGFLGITIPKSVAASLNIAEGDEVIMTVTARGLVVTPFDPDFKMAMEDARAFMRSHSDAFRALAK
jgi:putative addiction module antidote